MKSEETQIKGPRLEKPVRITDQIWPEGTMPVVSVFCITYNHVNFIRDAIEGFLMQETTFPVEIFIHDDASTDGTAEIIKEYAEKYPNLFWTVLQTENQWSKGNPNAYFFGLMQKQRGEFIAFCEGDDYWISKEKLQKQFGLLESRSDVYLCCHNMHVTDLTTSSPFTKISESKLAEEEITTNSLLEINTIKTGSVLGRKEIFERLPSNFTDLNQGDLPLWIFSSTLGKIIRYPFSMGCYRIHSGGVWSDLKMENRLLDTIRILLRAFPIIGSNSKLASFQAIGERLGQTFELSIFRSVNNISKEATRKISDLQVSHCEIRRAAGKYLHNHLLVSHVPKSAADLPLRGCVLSQAFELIDLASGVPGSGKKAASTRLVCQVSVQKFKNPKLAGLILWQAFQISFWTTIQSILKTCLALVGVHKI